MPKYYFHIRDGNELEVDRDGTDFESLDVAVNDARTAAREIMAEKLLSGEMLDGQRFEITDEEGVLVETVTFRSALNLQ
jgi:hypothetical protein